jgi:sodium/bile acid cotransporter 7
MMYVDYQKTFPEVPDMDPRQAMPLVNKNKIVFIDVRESEEQQVSMIPEAITASAYLENSEKYKDYLKIAYCTIAYRSGKFAQKLKDRGITIVNMRGGILAWVHDGGKVYDEHGKTNRIHVYGRRWDLAPEKYEAVW